MKIGRRYFNKLIILGIAGGFFSGKRTKRLIMLSQVDHFHGPVLNKKGALRIGMPLDVQFIKGNLYVTLEKGKIIGRIPKQSELNLENLESRLETISYDDKQKLKLSIVV